MQIALKVKQEQDTFLKRGFTMANDYERHSEVSIDEEGFHDAADSLNELVKLQFEFSAPKICL